MAASAHPEAPGLFKKRRLCYAPGCSAGEAAEIGINGDVFHPIREGYFNILPDDLVLTILHKLSSTAARPSDFISAKFS